MKDSNPKYFDKTYFLKNAMCLLVQPKIYIRKDGRIDSISFYSCKHYECMGFNF